VRILVVGQGGREHALVWKLRKSPKVREIYCAPGNAGTAADAKNVPIADDDIRELVRFARQERIDLAVIGPEAPLVAGLSDELRREGILVFGPSKDAALLEGSKIFCKRLLRKAKVPTADFQVFRDMQAVDAYLEAHPGPCVVKADGLAAGKGAIVCDNEQAARAAAQRMLVQREFGDAGDEILIEERLEGQEASVLAITDGTTIAMLDACQDHKRAFDNDQGPNTGGMGAYCPAPLVTPELLSEVERNVLIPVVHEMRRDKRPFQGVLYAGLMLTAAGPKVLEFNVRFGDPECQPLLLRLKTDLAELLLATAKGELDKVAIEWDPRPSICVVMASGGYPSMYKRGLPIRGLDQIAASDDCVVFHAGTKLDDRRVVTNGGRVLGVTALGADLRAAKAKAYEAVERITFTNAMYRKDIGDKAIANVESV
jgi:phosphoribosylamine--glycine ligase